MLLWLKNLLFSIFASGAAGRRFFRLSSDNFTQPSTGAILAPTPVDR